MPPIVLTRSRPPAIAWISWTAEHFPRETLPARLRELVDLSQTRGLGVSEFVVQQDVVTLDDGERDRRSRFVVDCINAARGLDVPLNVFTGPAAWDRTAPVVGRDLAFGQASEMAVREVRRWCDRAEGAGVDLALETVFAQVVDDYFTFNALAAEVGSARLGCNLDPSRWVLVRADIPWGVRRLGPLIKHVHLKDAVGRAGAWGTDFVFPILGEGAIDWPAFFLALDDAGYRGPMTIEYESYAYYRNQLGGSIELAAREAHGQACRLFDLAAERVEQGR